MHGVMSFDSLWNEGGKISACMVINVCHAQQLQLLNISIWHAILHRHSVITVLHVAVI